MFTSCFRNDRKSAPMSRGEPTMTVDQQENLERCARPSGKSILALSMAS